MRYVESSTNVLKQSTNRVYSTIDTPPTYGMSKSIGTFGYTDTPITTTTTDSSSHLTNMVNDLNAQIRRLTEKSDQLFNENRTLKKDSESLVLCRGRLEEKENELRKMISNNNFLENNVKSLKAELDKAFEQNRQLSTQLADVFNKNPGRYHLNNDTKRVMSAEEYELERKVKDLETKVLSVEKERDRLFIQNYELKKLHGDVDEEQDGDELTGMKYQNGLQIVNMDLNKARKKIEALTAENELVRNELNILRGIDCFEENEVKRLLNRNDDQTKC